MNSLARWMLAAVGAPIAGAFALKGATALEILVRTLFGKAAILDDAAARADAIVTPLLAIGYVVLCCIYVLPLSQVVRSLHYLLAPALIAAPPLFVAIALFHRPGLDFFPMTMLAMASFVGLPMFMSALAVRLIVGPNNSFQPTPLRGAA